jgi:flagellar biosynthesis/type III secretory pathway M-ring protein FliF/YscJ
MNVGSSGGGGGGAGSNSNTEENEFVVDHGKTDVHVRQMPGNATVVSAAVRVPRSYFLESYKIANGGKDPDDTALQTYMTSELTQIKHEVKGCTAIASDDAVVVGSYSDMMPAPAPVAEGTPPSPLSSALGSHSKEIGVGVLAAISLFMVSMMVRKSAPAATVVAPVQNGEVRPLQMAEQVVGKASEGRGALDGVELDEETVKAQQMLDQVEQMVQTNPDSAANLVKRWLNR